LAGRRLAELIEKAISYSASAQKEYSLAITNYRMPVY
jgi:hypothetical protein